MSSLPQVQLSFGASSGAWDDRALISACDSAMAEFHAHHPGPGSWLDKAMAAQLAGKPLEGVEDVSSSWYAASSSTPNEAGPSRSTLPSTEVQRPNKRARRQEASHQQADTDPDPESNINPYTTAISRTARPDRGASPHYAPTSPNPRTRAREPTPDDYVDQPEAAPHSSVHMPAPPGAGVCDVAGISEDDATSYAMTSQYWAGYWMGVAQSKKHSQKAQALTTPPVAAAASLANPQVVITRRDYGSKAKEGLRR